MDEPAQAQEDASTAVPTKRARVFSCDGCGYIARVMGGKYGGTIATVITHTCSTCRVLVDVPYRASRDAVALVRPELLVGIKDGAREIEDARLRSLLRERLGRQEPVADSSSISPALDVRGSLTPALATPDAYEVTARVLRRREVAELREDEIQLLQVWLALPGWRQMNGQWADWQMGCYDVINMLPACPRGVTHSVRPWWASSPRHEGPCPRCPQSMKRASCP